MDVMLSIGQPMLVAWDAACILLYNDAYAILVREHHPYGFGQHFFVVWFGTRGLSEIKCRRERRPKVGQEALRRCSALAAMVAARWSMPD